jgi:hypothetical protein
MLLVWPAPKKVGRNEPPTRKAEIDRDKVEAAAKAAEAKVCHRRL